MNAKFFWLIAAILLGFFHRAEAQQPKNVPRIGLLSTISSSSITGRLEAFRQGLHELRYVEGKNIFIEHRSAEGKPDRARALVTELMHLKVDVIVTTGPMSTRAAKEATATLPIVMAFDTDPVGNGFVASLARPGGNITGLSTLAPELSGKQLEILTEIIPWLSRVAVFGTSTAPGNAQSLRETELAAATFRVQIQYLDVLNPEDIGTAFRAAGKSHADAVLMLASPVLNSQRKKIAELSLEGRLPVIFFAGEYVDDEGLMSYAPQLADLFRRAATYVDKILKGAKPANLPVEQATKFELVINLKTAKQIGLIIPPSVLVRANKVIK
jgi:putative ABC transport system substrate-binding protein